MQKALAATAVLVLLCISMIPALGNATLWHYTAEEGWTMIGLDPVGPRYSHPYGVSADQQAGFSSFYRDNGYDYNDHASLWSGSAGSWVDLHPAGATNSLALGVSGGQQIGSANFDDGYFGWGAHAGLWSGTAASWVDLNPAGAMGSWGVGIEDGTQVGYAYYGYRSHAGFWTGTAASWVDLNPAGVESSMGLGVSGCQQVGSVEYYGDWQTRAALWNGTASSFVDLGPAGSYGWSWAYDVYAGQQVGSANFEVSDLMLHAGLWNGTAASWVDLNPAGAHDSEAYGVCRGLQVGYAYLGGVTRASLWSGTAESWVDLNALLPARMGSMARSIDVSSTGEIWITGEAWDTSPVPEPSSVLTLGCGLLAVAGVIRKRR